MNIEITGHNTEVTEAIHAHVMEKAEKLKKHADKWAMSLHVILTVEGYKEKENKRAEGILRVKNHKELVAHDISHDLYTAITNMFKNLDNQALKYKDKHE